MGCDPVRGCVCGEGWSGSACGDDIDECLASHACGDINKICTNSYGSFDCTCREGFKQGSEGLCEGNFNLHVNVLCVN